MKKEMITVIVIVLSLIIGFFLFNSSESEINDLDESWKLDGVELRQHESEGFYGCFGCGETLCIDPILEMKSVPETEERYCNADFEVIEAGNLGFVNGENEELELTLPVKKEDITEPGLGPFGVPIEGSHPFGHPGIDFALYEDRPIYASVDGTIMHVNESASETDSTFTLRPNPKFKVDIYYTGSMKEIVVRNGDKVKRGDLLAYSDLWGPEGQKSSWGNLHLGVQDNENDISLCPADFFTSEARAIAQELLDESEYKDKDKYPLLCNPCPDEKGCR